MKTLQEIQGDVIYESHGKYSEGLNWTDFTELAQNKIWPEVCRRTQLECARETLKEASKKAELIHCGNKMKEAITDEGNIKLIN